MRLLLLLALIGVSSAVPVFDDQILLAVPRLKNAHDSQTSHPVEWIQGPDSNLYQFHIGKQNWLAAREYCLARNSDLVSIKEKKQLDWVLEHYNPILPKVERVVQIGVLKSNHEWKWVDGSLLKSNIIDWKESEESDETCALLQLNDTRLVRNACDEAVFSRFICQRTNDVHEKQQRSDNFFWSRLETLFDYFGIGGKSSNATSNVKPTPDYYDEDDESKENSTEVNITSSERLELASIPISSKPLTSSEEEEQVDKVLGQLTKIPSVLPEKPKKPTRSSEEDGEEETNDFHDFKVHRAPAKNLKEISEVEGSGHPVEKYEITTEETITVEDPHKLQNIIDNMEKMLEDIEKIKVPGEGEVPEAEKTYQTLNPDENLLTTDSREKTNNAGDASVSITTVLPKVSKKKSSKKQKSKEPENEKKREETLEEKPHVSGVKNNVISDNLEEDFDSEKEKKMPATDIVPKDEDEDCDEKLEEEVEGSGEASSKLQKPLIPKEREEHIRKFLKTLRVFLARASHDDLRNVLDNKNQKSLLERMEVVIKQANAREFARLDNAQNGNLLPQQDETSVMMDEKEQEDLFKRISDVVLQQAQKEGIILTATEPSIRTTTEESKVETSKKEVKTSVKDEEKEEEHSVEEDEDEEEEDEETNGEAGDEESSEEDASVQAFVKKQQRQTKSDSSPDNHSSNSKELETTTATTKKVSHSQSKSSIIQSSSNVPTKTKRSLQVPDSKHRTNIKLRRQIKTLKRERKSKTRRLVYSRSSPESEKLKTDLKNLEGVLKEKQLLRQQRLLRRQRRRGDLGKRKFKRKMRKLGLKRSNEAKRQLNLHFSKAAATTPKAHVTKKATTIPVTSTTPRVTTSAQTTTVALKKAKGRQNRQQRKDKDERNPLGLSNSLVTSSLSPLPTFAPLPSLQEVFEKWDKSFRDLFKPLPTPVPPKF